MNLLSYFFKANPGVSFAYYHELLALGLLLIAGATTFHFYYQKKKRQDVAFKVLFKKVTPRFTMLGLLLLLLVAFRYENIPYFSMRLWLYGSFALIAYALYHYGKVYKVTYPKEKFNVEQKQKRAQSTKKAPKYTTAKK